MSLVPPSGAQGEYAGLAAIKAYLNSLGQTQRTVSRPLLSPPGAPGGPQEAPGPLRTRMVELLSAHCPSVEMAPTSWLLDQSPVSLQVRPQPQIGLKLNRVCVCVCVCHVALLDQ